VFLSDRTFIYARENVTRWEGIQHSLARLEGGKPSAREIDAREITKQQNYNFALNVKIRI
jgi:hypothetical protein